MVFSGVLHWLISQSIFLAVIESYKHFNPKTEEDGPLVHSSGFDVMTCGWSPTGIVATILTGTVLVNFMLGMGWRRLKSGRVVVLLFLLLGHGDKEEGVDGLVIGAKRVKRGVLRTWKGGGNGHCGFSADQVEVPVDGVEYR